MIIAEVIIPQMFTAYAEDMGYIPQNGLHKIQYFCEECDQPFAVAWGRVPGMQSWYERGNFFHCPYCGEWHGDYVAYIKKDQRAPNKVRLSLKNYKNLVVFEVYCDDVRFNDLFSVTGWKYKETFRFDIAKQTTTFSRYSHIGEKFDSVEIGNPFDVDILDKSILGFFCANSLGNKKQRPALNIFLRKLRDTVHQKTEKYLGHKISSMYVSSGQLYGTFLLPLLNIAFRLKFPDAPNLPTVYREGIGEIQTFWSRHMIDNPEIMAQVVWGINNKNDYLDEILAKLEIPNKGTVRREVSQNFFEATRLSAAFDLCKNYDYAIRLHTGFKQLFAEGYGNRSKALIKFLRSMLPIYGEAGIVQLVEQATEFNIWDCVRIYEQLTEENQQALKTERVRVKELHDWMVIRHRKQHHQNQKFDVPDYIVKRLSMQTNRLKFFLPEESTELLEAGAELHNCLATYSTAMKNNHKHIVLVADDNGRLAAGLEVQDKALVQAKIDRNRPVASDAKLNAEIIAWARAANLKIRTNDVNTATEEITTTAVS